MDSWFYKQKKAVQAVLLFIPVVNYVVEMLVRWTLYLRNGGTVRLILGIVVTLPVGILMGIADAICILAKGKLLFEKGLVDDEEEAPVEDEPSVEEETPAEEEVTEEAEEEEPQEEEAEESDEEE